MNQKRASEYSHNNNKTGTQKLLCLLTRKIFMDKYL